MRFNSFDDVFVLFVQTKHIKGFGYNEISTDCPAIK